MTRREAEGLINALDDYVDARAGLHAACDGPTDIRVVRHRECRERLLRMLADPPKRIVHAAWEGATKETVCEHEFSMFRPDEETWTWAKGNTQITCKTCRSILGLPPTL